MKKGRARMLQDPALEGVKRQSQTVTESATSRNSLIWSKFM